MYHCLDVVADVTSVPQDPGEDLAHQEVQAVEVEAEEDGSDQHHDGGGVDLLLRRPRHLLELAPDLGEEGLEFGELLGAPAKRPGEPRGRPKPTVFALVHLSCLCHGLHVTSSRSTPFRVAGQEGLEPPTPRFGDRCSTIELLAFIELGGGVAAPPPPPPPPSATPR